MKIDDYTKITHKHYSNTSDNDKLIKYLKMLITRVLISIIIIISIAIYIKFDDDNRTLVNKYLFEDNIKFTQINKWYQDKFGKIIPSKNESSTMVFSSNIKENKYSDYEDGIKIELDKNSPVSLLNGGIVIFIGEKEKYGNCIIVQGNDGYDYTYGNITNTSVNLYDYIEKDTLLGEAKDNYIYLVLEKDGKIVDYDEYLQKN